jgi:hypothetical protein
MSETPTRPGRPPDFRIGGSDIWFAEMVEGLTSTTSSSTYISIHLIRTPDGEWWWVAHSGGEKKCQGKAWSECVESEYQRWLVNNIILGEKHV